jgi:hypothetical protein
MMGKATVGLDLESAIHSMKPGDVKIVGTLKKFIVRYGTDETITVIQLSDGEELYRG